jgi:hypothetical protein
VFVAGLAVWIAYAAAWDPPRAWRALLINFIFFTPLAAGMVVWPALLTAARAEWLGPVRRSALAAVAFAPVSIAAFALLWFGREHWAAWMHEENLPNAAWLNAPLLFGRDAAALVGLWVLAAFYAARAARLRTRKLPAWLVAAYGGVFSLLGFDLVMALDPHWFSTLFGGYFFISGMYAAVAAWTLAAILSRPMPDADRRQDLGKLVVAFSLLATYMMFSQLIVIWYEQLPAEVRFVIPRLTQPPWKWVSAVLLGTIYLGPLVILLTVRAKRSPRFLGIVVAAVLVSLWLERWWLVTPTLGGEPVLGLVELSITAAMSAALALAVAWTMRRLPAPAAEEGERS